MEHTNVSAEKKNSIIKTLAILGFVAVLLLVAWLAIQLVHLLPSAFSSLASLADGVDNQETVLTLDQAPADMTITANSSLLPTGDNLVIDWQPMNAKGSYVFSYDCVEGVSLVHSTAAGDRTIDCGVNYNIGDTNSFAVAVESEKNRYADIPYTLAFLRTNDTRPRAEGAGVVTVVNTAINSQFGFSDNTPNTTPAVDPTPSTTPAAPATPSAPTTPSTPTRPSTPAAPAAPTQPQYQQEFVYAIPVSDPNGRIDLASRFVAMGEIINGAFVTGPVSVKNAGAVQFEVKNLGTKTSRDWTYTINLPNGKTYRSNQQTALKPNERALITVGFPAGATTPHTFTVTAETTGDRSSANNSFRKTITFAR